MTPPHSLSEADTATASLLAQAVYEACWDLLTHWHHDRPIRADAYADVFGPDLYAQPSVGLRLLSAEQRAILEASPQIVPDAGDSSAELDALLDLMGQQNHPAVQAAYALFAPPLKQGDLGQLGPFRMLREIGHGGFGVVFEAIHTTTNIHSKKHRAVKLFVNPQNLSKTDERLSREADALADISHRNVVKVYHSDQLTTATGITIHYLEMEYVYGPTLQSLIDHFTECERLVPIRLAVELVRQIASGLVAVHAESERVHRDIKPGNILLEWQLEAEETVSPWRVRLCDFGLVHQSNQPRLTSDGRIVGTRVYMAPEQLRPMPGASIPQRCDIFALGVMLYELVVGRHPFWDGTEFDAEVENRICHTEGPQYRYPHVANPRVPLELDKLICSMLARDPMKRPTAHDVTALLLDYQQTLERDSSVSSAPIMAPTASNDSTAKRAGIDRPLKVYLGSVTRELMPFRAAVVAAIRLHPTRYQVYPLIEYTQEFAFSLDDCLDWLEKCDLYVGVFGFRYGTVLPHYGASHAEVEQRKAKELKKPECLLLASKRLINREIEIEECDDPNFQINEYRRKLEPTATTFDSTQNLIDRVLAALNTIWLQETTQQPPATPFVGPTFADRLQQAHENYRKTNGSKFVFYNEQKQDAPENDPSGVQMPFLRSQQLYALKSGVDAKVALHPERFREARQASEKQSGEPAVPDAKYWEELDREQLVESLIGETKGRRVVFTTDAGLGKTTNLAWLEHECLSRGTGWVFALMASDIPLVPDLIPDILVPAIRIAKGNEALDKQELAHALTAARDAGGITLVIDGLDQAKDIRNLVALLQPNGAWYQCSVILAGRPFALETHWSRLFARQKSWQYVQITEMSSQQQEQLVGERRYQAIPEEARGILSTPRVLEFIRQLEDRELPLLRTVSDVYWRSLDHMLLRAWQVSHTDEVGNVPALDVEDQERFWAVLGVLAFTMYAQTRPCDTQSPGQIPNLDRVASSSMNAFQQAAYRSFHEVFPDVSKEQFKSIQKTLSGLNVAVNHGWLDVRAIDERMDLLWRNASLQEFLAAYWVSRWSVADANVLKNWVFHEQSGHNRGFYWLWRYASEMPDDVIWPDHTRPPAAAWVAAMTPLYVAPPDKDGLPLRSTEFLYRSWDRPGDPLSRSVAGQEARQQFQREFGAMVADASSPGHGVACELIADGAFIPLVGTEKVGDTGRFMMGSAADEPGEDDVEKPCHEVRLTPYALHRYCVRNVEYELFDPWHTHVRWDGETPHPDAQVRGQGADDDCPVVNVTWYDGWCFAKWMNEVVVAGEQYRVDLPSEARWEYACRAGQRTPFTFGVDHTGMSVTPDVCNFDGNYPFPKGTSTAHVPEAEVYREKTIGVGKLGPNRWGFYQMHGNVWEWCTDWYLSSFYASEEGVIVDPENLVVASARVLRGGSWIYDGRICRSANRSGDGPSNRGRYGGFRLAAVPVLGAKSSTE